MRAFQLPKGGAGIESLTRVDVPDPKPLHRQVLVKVAACSLNFRDLGIVRGTYRMPVRDKIVPLSDGAGEVVEVGSGVTRVKAGDKVAGCFFQRWAGGEPSQTVQASALGGSIDGMLAEYAVLEEDGVVKVPQHLSPEEAATLPCAALTAWHAMVQHAKVVAGQTVLLQGTGGVSIFGLQFAHAMGLTSIITSSSDEKLKRAKALGAAHTINYKTTPDWEKAAVASTGGRGVDHVVEVGGNGTLAKSIRAVRIGGHIALIGVLAGGEGMDTRPLLMKNIRLHGISVGSREMFEQMNKAIVSAKLHPIIDRTFAFEDTIKAFSHLESGSHFGKVVIKIA